MTSHFLTPNPRQCKSCIFRTSRDGGLELPPERMAEVAQYLRKGSQHVCHTNPDRACRGGRDLQLRVFAAMGIIGQPTDEALAETNQAFLKNSID